MASKTKKYSVHCVVAFIAMALPLLISFVKKDNKPNLVGIVISENKPEFSSSDWFNGSYQYEMEEYNNDHWAFKEISVRLNNQFYYDAFNQIRVNQFVSGKENYVFAEATIHSYYGSDYMGDAKIAEYLRKCKVLQDTLAKKGISLILAYAPGKGFGASQYIEDKYHRPVGKTNISEFAKQSKQMGINHIDFVDYFNKAKDTCQYPLYARFAHHWTYYFDCLASKKLISYVEELRKTDLPDIMWSSADVSDTARSRDKDVLLSMNLYNAPAQSQKLLYPNYQVEDAPLKNQTHMLTIGDSYWYGIVYMGIPQNCFAGGQFWYYYKRVVPSPVAGQKVEAWELDLKQSIESSQVVLIIGSDPALPAFGWGFVEDAYELYTDPARYYTRMEKTRAIKQYEKQIRDAPLLLKKSTQKSRDLQLPLDSAIKLDAMKMAGMIK